MKFSIGDKILLKRTGEEGTVIAMLSNSMMEVAVNGIHFPVYNDEVDHPYLKWFTERKVPARAKVQDVPVERVKERPPRLVQGIYLSFMPVYIQDAPDDVVDQLRIFLVNETAGAIHYDYDARTAGGARLFRHQGTLHAFGNVFLHALTLGEMNGQPRFNWQLSDDKASLAASVHKGTVRIRPQKLFDHLTAMLHSGAPSFTYLLADDAPGQSTYAFPIPDRIGGIPVTDATNYTAWQPRQILDLHIEALRADYELLSPAEILRIQTDTLHDQLDLAIAHRQRDMVIIHGLGTGTLRMLVQQVLLEKRGVDYFRNEWNGRYGYGATTVHFK